MNSEISDQFNSIYRIRSKIIKPLIKPVNNLKIYDSILEVKNSDAECIITGILFISSDLKTTIFDKINTKTKVSIKKETYMSKDVKYYMEDETGRIELIMTDKVKDFVTTGMYLGFRGYGESNKFIVNEIIYPQKIENNKQIIQKPEKGKIAIVSGIEISKGNKNMECLKVLFDYLVFHDISTFIIFGKFFIDDWEKFKMFLNMYTCKLILVPEYDDLSCKTYPLNPLHSNLLNSNVCSVANPSYLEIFDNNFVVYSSKIINDLLKYIKQDIENIQKPGDGYRMHLKDISIDYDVIHNTKDIIHLVKAITKCRILCPNAPDTLPTMPYGEKEIFFIDKHIDYFIIPNCDQEKLEREESLNLNILMISNFNLSKKLIVLNIEDNNYEVIKFNEDSLY